MVSRRSGHSLPELIVALTLLGATVAAVASSAVMGGRWTHEGVTRQGALAVAEAVLDSLTALAQPPASGDRDLSDPPWMVKWVVAPGPASHQLQVRVDAHAVPGAAARTRPLAEAYGLWVPPLPAPLPAAPPPAHDPHSGAAP
jgi:Tfp pilus assembly protein PilV